MTNKEPWLAVNLSKIIPGLGQIYSGDKRKGYTIIFLYFILLITSYWLIFSISGSIILGLISYLCFFAFYIWNLFDAYNCAKRKNSQEFENLRKQSKDPWLATFLSNAFSGSGYFYLKDWSLGILTIILLFVAYIISLFFKPIVYALICYFTYIFSPVHRENSKNMALIVAILIAISGLLNTGCVFSIRRYGVESRWILSGAMEPTLLKADSILVDKFSYHFQEPKRGDIIVFSPTDALIKEQYQNAFIQRIVGLPGDKLELKNGKVYINNQALAEDKYLSPNQQTFIDVCVSGKQPPYLAKSVTIPPDSYFVLGDNRNSSYDSRCWGVVPRDLIIGKAYKRYFPLERVGAID